MVKVEELRDEDDGFVTEEDDFSDPSEAGAFDPSSSKRKSKPSSDDGFSDLDPDSDDDDDADSALVPFDPSSETLFDRLFALKDVVPPSTRASIARRLGAATGAVRRGGRWVGGAAWVVTTSMLLVGLPVALSIEAESMLVQQEKELERQQQGQQSLTGLPSVGAAPGGPGASTGQKTVTPPGF